MRCVIQNKVHDHAEPAIVSILEEFVEVLECAKARVDIDVIAHVVAEIMHGRWIDRGQPNRIYPERGRFTPEVLQPGSDTGEIADTIVIGVLKTPGIDLIKDGGLPPRSILKARHSRHSRCGQ